MHELDPNDLSRMVTAALEVRDSAYAPYSQIAVGATLLSNSNELFRGCNVENASYGLTICAERTACGLAVSSGCRSFRAIAIASEGAIVPCGACRQFLAEFAPDLWMVLVDANRRETVRTCSLRELFPDPFQLD